ncbi:MAG TPA: DUF6390 family protein, partial [Candidatus Acidoferrales bacterium]|nr:DUF6390 family protein [Candidatus Acidoferrales bacterium]
MTLASSHPPLPQAPASPGEDAGLPWSRPVAPEPGPLRFARYAFGPNKLGYCGPDAASELFQQA